jgi:hypothetical protein
MRPNRLSARTTRVLRAIVLQKGEPGYEAVIAAAGGSWYYVADAIATLEKRGLVQWDSERQIIRPFKSAHQLLSSSRYRNWGQLNG